MRLVRSHRKLEAVLGTVPYYLEPECSNVAFEASISKTHRREGRMLGHSPASSIASSSTSSLLSEESYVVVDKSIKSSPLAAVRTPNPKSSKKQPRALELSRPLLLRLRSVPLAPTDSRSAALLSPRLPTVASRSPTSPTFTIDLEKCQATSLENRRKKMAKLARTLGENIPPELVFPSSPDPNATEKPGRSRNPQRKPIPSSFATPAAAPLSPHNSPAKPPVTISRPKSKSRRPSITVTAFATAASPQPPKAAQTLAERRRKHRPRSLSLSTGTDMFAAATHMQSHAPRVPEEKPTEANETHASAAFYTATITIDEKATRDVLVQHSPPAFQTTIPEASAAPASHRYARSSPSNIYQSARQHQHSMSASSMTAQESMAPSAFVLNGKRKEKGWSGEWNQDMGNVVRALRGLKAR
ncbi:hypothetical protein LshimejAT787_0311780 [Lyophyllum shimeji]|uniref:Uncharacterized protein n=1 Tax=Lyophyllum shimeji TaxID=47721 RepID=A0A9P3PJG8_LYOSH|nr:hypothetical protein LshimejAT787_0311780 [Lyophyllum shimeji]